MTSRDARAALLGMILTIGVVIGWTVAAQQPVTVTNGAVDYAEDAAHVSGHTGPVPLTRRIDAAATSAAAGGNYATMNTDATGLLWTRLLDPCTQAKQKVTFSINTATTTELINGTGAALRAYICALNIGPTAGAQNLALVEDDTDNCASPTLGMAGGVTAATGWNIPSGGGLTFGNGLGTITDTSVVNRFVCLISSSTAQTSGVMVYALAP